MKKLMLLPITLLVLCFTVSAQKIVKEVGDFSKIKGETKLKLEYNFDNFGVGKYPTEKEYVDYKKAEYAKKDEATAQKFEDGWKAARDKYYQPKFEELFNKTTKGKISAMPSNIDAKYTLIIKTTFIEPGFNVGVMKKPAYVNFEYIIVETANPENVVAKYSQSKVPGSQYGGYDFDASTRISESYAKGAKMLAGTIMKAIK